MNEFGIALFWCALQVTLLSIAAGLCYFVVRKFRPAAGSMVALTGLIVVIGLSMLVVSPWPQWTNSFIVAEQTPNSTGEEVRSDSATTDLSERAARESEQIKADQFSSEAVSEVRIARTDEQDEPAFGSLLWNAIRNELRAEPTAIDQSQPWHWTGILGVVVMTGIGFGVIRLALGWWSVRAYRRGSIPIRNAELLELVDVICAELSYTKPVEVRDSMELVTAATVGWRRPLILLPSEWTRWSHQERRAVLAHETAHIARNDFLAWICAQIGVVLHFYHPLVHWLAGRLRLEQEIAADAAAARLSGGRQTYLQTLASMALRQAERPVSWPARTFLPTRRTFLRRIEMLRDKKKFNLNTLSRGSRAATIGLLILAGIAAAGLRSPGNQTQAADDKLAASTAVEQQSKATVDTKPFDLSYVPDDTVMLFALHPADTLSLPAASPLARRLAEDLGIQQQFGLDVSQIEQFLIAIISKRNQAMYITMKKPTSFQKLIESEVGIQVERREYKGKDYYTGTKNRPMAYFIPNERTIILADPESIREVIDAGETGATGADWASTWKEVQNDQFAAIVTWTNPDWRRELLGDLQRIPAGHPLNILAPHVQNTNAIVVGASLNKQLKMKTVIDCVNEETAGNVKETANAMITLGKNMVAGFRQQLINRPPPESEKILVESLLNLGDKILNNVNVEQKKNLVRLISKAQGVESAKLLAELIPAVTQARTAARRTQARNNLKQIAIAFHNYHDVNKHFPPAVVMGPDGKTPHSWRVALLPYLDQKKLYDDYKLNEPWDSPSNKKVLAKMPMVFRDPNMPANSTNAAYFVLTGELTAFGKKEGTRIRDIPDGTSNTLLVVESKQDIPWTKPVDLPFDPEKGMPKLGGFYKGGFNAALCDGSVRFIPEGIDEDDLKALITIDGREIIN